MIGENESYEYVAFHNQPSIFTKKCDKNIFSSKLYPESSNDEDIKCLYAKLFIDICHYYVTVSVLVKKSVILFKNCKMMTSNIQNIPNLHLFITCWHEDGIKAKKCCN